MELTTIFLIWLLITVIDNLAKRKKRRLPPPQKQNDAPDFDIPTLANDPNLPGEEIPILLEQPRQAEVRTKDFTPPRPKKFSEPTRKAEAPDELDLSLTPSNVMNAIVLAEILGKPKALRNKSRRSYSV